MILFLVDLVNRSHGQKINAQEEREVSNFSSFSLPVLLWFWQYPYPATTISGII
jgi:hypothetical protein